MENRSYTYPNGAYYEGEWKGNQRHGYGVLVLPDGTRYTGYWADNQPDGKGLIVAPDGSYYNGEWRRGKKHGEGVFSKPDGTMLSGQWFEGRFTGKEEPPDADLEKEEGLEPQPRDPGEKTGELDLPHREKKKSAISFAYLKKFNLVMGLLHLTQGILMMVFALTIDQIRAFKTPIWSYFLEFDTTLMRLVTRPELLWELPFGIFVSLFLLLSALAHFIIVSPVAHKTYLGDLKRGINRFRWYEYSLSSSLMIILIAQLFGVYDIGALIAIFLLNAAMNLFGLMMEEVNQHTEETKWSPFVFGCIAGIGPWIVIIMHALGNADPAEVPWFVYAIIGSYFVFFNLFPVNMVLQYKKVGKWADYLYGERGYIILSLVAKSVLAWLVFAGVMQPM